MPVRVMAVELLVPLIAGIASATNRPTRVAVAVPVTLPETPVSVAVNETGVWLALTRTKLVPL